MVRRRALLLVLALLVAFLVGGVLAPAALAYRMDVPVWKQGDPRWASLHLDGSPYTMATSGCAVTSGAMVADYFGSSKDPGGLCLALNANGGLTSTGALYWQKVPPAAGGTISYIGRWDYCSLSLIDQELDHGYPVIVQVRLSGNTHFVVLTGRDGSTYYINDPAYGDRTTLNARYGSPSTAIHGFRVYHGTHAAPPPPSPYTRYQQTDSRLFYSGTWYTVSTTSASGGSFKYANTSGASVTVAFNGTYLAWITKKSPVYGIAKVTLDGKTPVLVDLYSSGTYYQQKVWNTGTVTSGTHTVKIEWTGTKNAAATGTNIGVDAFDLLGSLASTTRHEQTDSHLVWTPSYTSWTTGSSSYYSGGSIKYINTTGSVTINFTGVSLKVITKKSTAYGKAKITLDGTTVFTVSFYNATTVYKQVAWWSGFLVPGNHTVKIEWTGTKSVSTGGTNVNLDAVDVIGVLR